MCKIEQAVKYHDERGKAYGISIYYDDGSYYVYKLPDAECEIMWDHLWAIAPDNAWSTSYCDDAMDWFNWILNF